MKLKLSFCSLLLGVSLCAQEKLENNTYEKIKEGLSTSLNSQDYDKSIELINKINSNDSMYNSLLITKSYAYLNLKKYNESLKVIDEALLKNDIESKYSLLLNKSVCFEGLKKYDKAIKSYDILIEEFPKANQLYYNRALIQIKKKEWNKAYDNLESALLFSPLDKDIHYKIGELYYIEKQLSQSIMALSMYLLSNPDGEDSYEALRSINTSFSRKSKTEPNNVTYSDDDKSFKSIDLILSNGLALNPKYKIKNKIKLPLVKQLNVFFEQIDNYKGNNDFWDKKMIPFFKWIKSSGNFDNFIYTICYSTENPSYKKVIEKNTPKIIEFIAEANTKWLEIVSKDNLEFFEEKEQLVNYVYEEKKLVGVGKVKGDNKVGLWDIYDKQGKLNGKGAFSESGKREGLWEWYDKKGNIKESAVYKDGKFNGLIKEYHKDGKLAYKYAYVEGKLEGEYFEYSKNGKLFVNKEFKDGKLEGGKLNGSYKTFYNSGELFSDLMYKEGTFTGEEITYYRNKEIRSKSNYLNNNLNGKSISYFKNGNISNEGNYTEGNLSGIWKEYFLDGTLYKEITYNNKGKLNGSYKEYDIDGKLYYEYIYKNDLIVSTIYYDKDSNVLINNKRKGGKLKYKGYSSLGSVEAKGLYNIKGGEDGQWQYFENGVLESESTFEDGALKDVNKWYFIDGDLESKAAYKEGKKEGYSVGYYENGQMRYQGYNKEDQAIGEWRYYYIDGTISDIDFYHKGEKHGVQQNFSVDGKLYSEITYEYGSKLKVVFYHPDGSVLEEENLSDYPGEEVEEYLHFNNKTYSTSEYEGGERHGAYKRYHFNGKIKLSGNYGNLEGEIKTFKKGKLSEIEFYKYGEEDGINTIYYPDGVTVFKEFTNKNGKAHGTYKFFAPNGKLQFVRFYHNGNLIGYSYEDSEGKLKPMISLPNGTGKIEAFFDNGKKSAEIDLKHSEFVGTYKKYFYNGAVQELNKYSDKGSFNGTSLDYYSNGKIQDEINYVYGKESGVRKKYFKNGQLQQTSSYLNGSLHGEAVYYNESGKKIKQRIYHNGSIIKEMVY